MKRISIFLLFCLQISLSQAQEPVGDWTGLIPVQNIKLEIDIHIRMVDGNLKSTFDSPDQGAYGLQFDDTQFSGNSLTLTARTLGIQYRGILSAGGDTIDGNWYQGGGSIPLLMKKMKPAPAKPKPSNETDIVLKTPSGDIAGTLCMPSGKKKIPVVLIIAGSGPTDRNGNSPPALMNKSNAYKMLADELLKNGIASVRYDKRGVAGSASTTKSESDLRFDDYIADAAGWIELLSQDKRFSKVIVTGHSEGSLIGMSACAGSKAAAFISVAGAGRSAPVVLREQLSSLPDDLKEQAFNILAKLEKGDTTANIPQSLASLLRPQIQPYMISWFRHDPCSDIAKLSIPVLILQGAMDIQISTTDAEALGKCSPQSTVKIFPKMNHVLKDCDSMDKAVQVTAVYKNPDLPLDADFVESVVGFVGKLK
jgi:pimeloyl-ACP methyl ester carboxylesterase